MNILNLTRTTRDYLGHPARALPLAAVSDITSVITPRESLRRVLTAIALPLTFFVAGTAQAGSSTWTTPTEYTSDSVGPWPDWNDPARWNGGTIPNGQGDVATFSGLTNRLNFRITSFSNGAASPGSSTSITLGGLVHTGAGRLDSRPYGPTSTIVWDNGASNAVLSTSSNSELLLAHNHTLNSSLVITKPGQQTRLQLKISGPGGIILSGNQELVLGETGTVNDFAGGVTFLDTSAVDVRRHTAAGTGAITFTNTSTANSVIMLRNNWSGGVFVNNTEVATGGFGKMREEGGDPDREFSGALSGGGSLTLEPKDSLWKFTGTNTGTGPLTIRGDGSANAAFGVEGVFSTFATINLANAAVLKITNADAIGDSTTVTLDANSFINVGTGLNEVIGSGLLTVNSVVIPNGTYDNTASWLEGNGTITVGAGGLSSGKDILSFGPGAVITGTNIAWTVPFGTNLSTLAPTYTMSALATGSPLSGATVDFAPTNQATYTITAQNSTTQTYTVTVSVAQPGSLTWTVPTEYPSDSVGPWPDWNDPAHWDGGTIPNGQGQVATFSGLTNRLNFRITDFSNGAASPGNSTSITLGGLVHTGAGRLDSRPYGPTSTIVWDNGASNAVLSTSSNSELLLAHNHTLNSSLVITKPGQQTRLQLKISGPGGIILSGNQELVLGETGTVNDFAGGVTFLDTSAVDVRRHTAAGTGAITFTNTSTANSVIMLRNNWSGGVFVNNTEVATGGFGKMREEGGDPDREFSGALSGGGSLTLEPKDSLWKFTGTNTGTGPLTIRGDGSANAAFGVEGVFSTFATINLANAAVLKITNADAIGDSTTVTLDANSFINVGTGLNEVIGSGLLTVNSVVIPNGTYDNTASWLEGNGTITVGPSSPANSYASWASTKYPGANLTDSAADLDGDGMSNFAEYAFGLNPTTGASLNPVSPLVGNNFSYTRTSDTGLTYKVWHSMNLQDWFSTLATQGTATSLGGGVESVPVTLDGSLLTEPKLFLRVTAE